MHDYGGMMTSIYDYIGASCTDQNWFSDTLRYSGHGVIALKDPHLVIAGDATVSCSQNGNLSLRMGITFVTEDTAHLLFELIGTPYELDTITVTTDTGVFISTNGWITRTRSGNSETPH